MIGFTRHAKEKFDILGKYGINIPERLVIDTINAPDKRDSRSRKPLIAVQSNLDEHRALKVIYKQEDGVRYVITFYPIKK